MRKTWNLKPSNSKNCTLKYMIPIYYYSHMNNNSKIYEFLIKSIGERSL